MIGLFKAILSFSSDKDVPFSAYAELCIKRQIFTAIKTAARGKHLPLNFYVSIHEPALEYNMYSSLINIADNSTTRRPDELFEGKEIVSSIKKKLNRVLSRFEKKVLIRYLKQKSYRVIAQELGCNTKSIDNALLRTKKKITNI